MYTWSIYLPLHAFRNLRDAYYRDRICDIYEMLIGIYVAATVIVFVLAVDLVFGAAIVERRKMTEVDTRATKIT